MNNRDNADVTMTLVNMFPGQEKTAQEDPRKVEIHIPFKCLSELTTSFTGGSLAVIASRPAMGKTSFALDIAKILAANSERNIVFFSLELSVEWVMARLRMKDSHSEAIPPNILIYDEYFMSVTEIKRISYPVGSQLQFRLIYVSESRDGHQTCEVSASADVKVQQARPFGDKRRIP